ncbi:MAG: hypothetical protein KDM91_08990 [Verrucomicrobiae bacterium]|nr:hypothetical protein [Verrucomicrobiae bacterium]MCP5539998.1 hypothetical protein [Akkermansiaceae bacterium]MCP5549933.1 hypothetical protein [Akkermansiaceae bacterium]
MKTAYELAMERLGGGDPVGSLSDEQKAELAALDEKFRAKIAEKELFLGDLIAKAKAEGRWNEIGELEEQRARELKRLREQCESEKDAVREKAG